MNTDDLRVIKTRKLIRNTFLQMRSEMPLEKIRVRELCKRAMINKSTFYNHYPDVFALSDELEEETIAEFLSRFDARDCLFTDPMRFLSEMPVAFDANMNLLMPLFKDRLDTAFNHIERQIKAMYDHDDMTEEEDIRLTYVLGGALHTLRVLKFDRNYSNETLARTVSALIQRTTAKGL